MRRRWWVALVALVLVGCVTKGEYNELKAEYADYREKAEERDALHQASIKDLERALAEERARLAALGGDKAKLEARLDALTSEKATLLKDRSKLLAAEAEMKLALKELERRKAQAEKRVAAYQDLLNRFKTLIDAGKLRVRIIDGQMVVELATDILFGSGSAVLSRDGKAAIAEVTTILASIPERAFQVAGHTDNVPINTARYRSNWELAYDRAMSVVRTMLDSGMPHTRISAASYAEHRPAATNDSDEGRALNRRIEIVVVPDLSALPGAEELKKLGDG